MFRILHYQNHFFGQSGRSRQPEHAGMEPSCREGAYGPGTALSELLSDLGGIAATIVAGDDYMFLNRDAGMARIAAILAEERADLLVAGPAFGAGRYGLACGAACAVAVEASGMVAVTGMHPDNPGAGKYPENVFAVATGSSIAGMRDALPAMAGAVRSLLLRDADALFAIPRLAVSEDVASGRPDPAPPVPDLTAARIALATEGGLVPAGNPDMLGSSGDFSLFRYETGEARALLTGTYKTVHGGVDRAVINDCPERLVPFSTLKELERSGRIGSAAGYFHSTTGNGTSPEHCRSLGRDLAAKLRDDGVHAVILTAT